MRAFARASAGVVHAVNSVSVRHNTAFTSTYARATCQRLIESIIVQSCQLLWMRDAECPISAQMVGSQAGGSTQHVGVPTTA
jgi:hypothetical protein